MRRQAGRFIVLFGVWLMAMAAGQFFFADLEARTTDPNPNLVGNGMLLTLGWYTGILVIGIGLVVGRYKASKWI
jgi:hypothetical protein